MKLENKILTGIEEWLSRKGKNISIKESINNQDITSLEILELLSELEVKLNVTFVLSQLTNDDYFSLQSLSNALQNNFYPVAQLIWYRVEPKYDLYNFKNWIEIQFNREVKFKVLENTVLVGVPQNWEYTKILDKLRKVVEQIERYC